MVTMINDLRVPMLITVSMMFMLMAMLVSVTLVLVLLLFKLFFGGRLEPCLVDLHINSVLRAAGVAFPHMLLMECYSVKWLPG